MLITNLKNKNLNIFKRTAEVFNENFIETIFLLLKLSFHIHCNQCLKTHFDLNVYYSPELSSINTFLWQLVDSMALHGSLAALRHSSYLTRLGYPASRFQKIVQEGQLFTISVVFNVCWGRPNFVKYIHLAKYLLYLVLPVHLNDCCSPSKSSRSKTSFSINSTEEPSSRNAYVLTYPFLL